MTRLPTPGSDDGQWGQILNDFLSVEHNTDGTLKNVARPSDITNPSVADESITTAKLSNNAVTNVKLDPAIQTSLVKADSSVQSVNSKTPVSGAVTLTANDVSAVSTSQMGAANGVATLDGGGKVPTGQLPSITDSGAVRKGDLVINVKDYGATGNGSTDDTTAIQSAVNAASTGVLVFPRGTYIVSQTIVIPNHIVIDGLYGKDRSFGVIIKQAAGANLDAVIAHTNWYNNSTGGGDFFVVRNIIIDGNGSNQTSGMGIGIVGGAYRAEIDNCMIENTRGDGIRLTDITRNGTTLTSTGSCVENRVSNCIISSFGLGGLAFVNGSNTGPGTEGVAIRDGNNNLTDWFVTNTVIRSGSNGHGIYADKGSGGLITGNHTYSTGLDGIYVKSASFTRIIDNYVEGFGTKASAGNVHGIYVMDIGVGGTNLANNTINLGAQGNGNTWYGIFLENNSAGGFAKWAVGQNNYYTTTASGTCLRVQRNVSGNPSLTYAAQCYSGSFPHILDIDSSVNLIGGGVGGSYNMSVTTSITPDPGKGEIIWINGNMTAATAINNPSTGSGQGSAGMKFSLYMITGVSSVVLTFGDRYHLGALGSAGTGNTGGTYTLAANRATIMSFIAPSSGFGWFLHSVTTDL